VLVVDPATGQLWIETVELAIDAQPWPLVLGRSWSHESWQWRGGASLTEQPGVVTVSRPEGSDLAFPFVGLDPDERCPAGSIIPHDEGYQLLCLELGFELRQPTEPLALLRFDDLGRLLERRESSGRILFFQWHDQNLASITGLAEATISLSEPSELATRRVQKAHTPAGTEARYQWDERGRLNLVVAGTGARHRYIYDDQDRLSAILWGDGARAVIRRDEQGRVAAIDGPGAQRWRYHWSEEGLERAFDGHARPWTIDRDERQHTLVDPAGRRATLLLKDGQVVGWRDPAGRTTRVERDASGGLRGLQDSTGQHWRLETDDEGQLTTLADPLGGRWSLERDAQGHTERFSDPAGRVSRYRPDELGRILELRRGGGRLGFRRDEQGRVISIVHGNGSSTRIGRDADGRVTELVDATGNTTHLDGHKARCPGDIRDATGASWRVLFDGLGRPSGLRTPDGTLLGWTRTTSDTLNLLQREQAISRLGVGSDGRPTRLTDPLGRITGWILDATGRLRSWRRPDGSLLRLARDMLGEVSGVRLGDTSLALTRDGLGRPVAVSDGQTDGPPLVSWDRDPAGRVRAVHWPHASMELDRDASGRVRQVDIGERSWELERDSAGRLMAVAQGTERWRIARDLDGLVQGLEDPAGTLQRSLDPRGVVRAAQLAGLDMTWQHDAAGRPLRVQGPDGTALGVRWDRAGRPASFRLPGGSMVWCSYGQDRLVLRFDDPSGDTLDEVLVERDALGRLATRRDADGERRYRYGPLDELVSIEEGQGAWSVLPGLREGPGGSLVVSLDPLGRPSTASTHLATPAWGVAREHLRYVSDEQGRLLRVEGDDGIATLEHDALGHLRRITLSDRESGQTGTSASWRLRYDPFGRPYRIDGPGGNTHLFFSDGQILGLQQDGRSAVLLEGPLGMRVLAGEAGWTALPADQGGAPVMEIDSEGGVRHLRTAPGGLPLSPASAPFGAQGRFVLYPGGPLLGPEDVLEPLSGLPTVPDSALTPWSGTGWPSPDASVVWPSVDGAASVDWDPDHWSSEGPWDQPLSLLVTLGLLPAPTGTSWWSPAPAVAPLPWMPASLSGEAPPLGPRPGAWPLQADPVVSAILAAIARPTRPIDERSLTQALLQPDLRQLPRPLPGLPLPGGVPVSGP